MPRLHVVFGAYEGPIDAKPGEKVVFIGDCANWEGTLGDKLVKIESLYRDRSTKDPHERPARRHLRQDGHRHRQAGDGTATSPHVRLEGCPVSVAEQVLALVSLGKLKNPYLSPEQIVRFNKGYIAWRGATVAKRLGGTPYQIHGPCSRGEAAPDMPQGEAAKQP